MLLSKRSEMFLPIYGRRIFQKLNKSLGFRWNEFYRHVNYGDYTNILGYGNDEVDEAVRSVINKGNMSTFNCPEEVYLSEKLINSSHGYGKMLEVAVMNSIARIADTSKVSTRVAVCIHGWHDWYLSANLTNNDNLGTIFTC